MHVLNVQTVMYYPLISMDILYFYKKGNCMKMFKVILLGVMFIMFGGASLAAGGGGGGGGGGGASGGGKAQNQTRSSAADKTQDRTKDKAQDRTQDKAQDKDRIRTPGAGTATPAVVPATN